MNELQLVLLVFAVIVISVLVFLNQKKKSQLKRKTQQTKTTHSPKIDARDALNDLGEGHVPVSHNTQSRLIAGEGNEQAKEEVEEVPESQGALNFGEDFSTPTLPETPESIDLKNQADNNKVAASSQPELKISALTTEPTTGPRKPKHFVLYEDNVTSVEAEYAGSGVSPEDIEPRFGKPNTNSADEDGNMPKPKEPQVFVIIVMGSQEFNMVTLNQVLLSVGLGFNDQGIYTKLDSMNKEYIHIANVIEPGTFPSCEAESFKTFTTPGIAMIMELPTSVKSVAAMDDMILIARKVSQKMNGRLYDGQRHLLKESDIKVMRDAAFDFEMSARQ